MPIVEPATKRCIAFFDGQNLFYAAKEAFGYPFPNYDPMLLAQTICKAQAWQLIGVRFYTGIPDPGVDPDRHFFWARKLQVMGTRGIHTFTRPLRYQNKAIFLPNGTMASAQVGREKGVDVRIALDVVRLALENGYDVGLLFSQDQDLSEAVEDVRRVAKRDGRWIKLASAFPVSPTYNNRRGVNQTDWVRIDRTLYDSCIDPADYRRKTAP
jgi:uncharacterized LabA/DUF88 family protein